VRPITTRSPRHLLSVTTISQRSRSPAVHARTLSRCSLSLFISLPLTFSPGRAPSARPPCFLPAERRTRVPSFVAPDRNGAPDTPLAFVTGPFKAQPSPTHLASRADPESVPYAIFCASIVAATATSRGAHFADPLTVL